MIFLDQSSYLAWLDALPPETRGAVLLASRYFARIQASTAIALLGRPESDQLAALRELIALQQALLERATLEREWGA